MTKLEVRCCCDPEKLFGWVYVQDPWADAVTFQLLGSLADFDWSDPVAAVPIETLRLPIDTYSPVAGTAGRAVKADGVPLELLRRIPVFVCATERTN